tara:strand:+ start:2343 stop:2924 length:582 start_codon:yes stop_codon:yes gene_type:complete
MSFFDTIKKDKFVVVDDFLHKLHAEDMEKAIFDPNFPLYYMKDSIHEGLKFETDKIIRSPQFVHLLSGGGEIFSQHFDMMVGAFINQLETCFEFANTPQPTRCKINLKLPVPNATEDHYDAPHVDNDKEHIAVIYYVNDTDGDTFIFDDDHNIIGRVHPRKNRILAIDGSVIHAGGFPIQHTERCVVNYNFTR